LHSSFYILVEIKGLKVAFSGSIYSAIIGSDRAADIAVIDWTRMKVIRMLEHFEALSLSFNIVSLARSYASCDSLPQRCERDY